MDTLLRRRPKPLAPAFSRKVRRASLLFTALAICAFAWETNWVIGEIQGELIHDPKYTSEYCFDLEDGRMLEPQPPLRYVNHSCEPNCEFNWFDVTDTGEFEPRRRVFLIALRDIKSGEELTINYNWPIESAIPCRCRAPSCRGWIVVPGELEALIATKIPRHGIESLHVGSRDS